MNAIVIASFALETKQSRCYLRRYSTLKPSSPRDCFVAEPPRNDGSLVVAIKSIKKYA